MNEKKVLLIVPTRKRPQSSIDFFESFKDNSSFTDLLFGLDDDDDQNYPRISNVLYEVGPRLGMNGTLNKIALKYVDRYPYIAFMGDDHRIRTKDWDLHLTNLIGDLGLAYGNDLFAKERLPTSVVMSANIIKAIGFVAPPKIRHLFIDDFWLTLGKRLNGLHYSEETIIEHLHYMNGKADKDDSYIESNSNYWPDKSAFDEYMESEFEADIQKIQALVAK